MAKLYCLSFIDIRVLITLWGSSNLFLFPILFDAIQNTFQEIIMKQMFVCFGLKNNKLGDYK